jgi:biopolymer transport protein ExbD
MEPLEPLFTLPRSPRTPPRAEITALIDVVLLLLVFVLLTSQYVVTPGFDVMLPAATVEEGPGPRPLVLQIPQAPESPFFLNGSQVAGGDLAARLEELGREQPEDVLVIAPDRRAATERLLQALEAAQAAGFARIRIATENGAGPPAPP